MIQRFARRTEPATQTCLVDEQWEVCELAADCSALPRCGWKLTSAQTHSAGSYWEAAKFQPFSNSTRATMTLWTMSGCCTYIFARIAIARPGVREQNGWGIVTESPASQGHLYLAGNYCSRTPPPPPTETPARHIQDPNSKYCSACL